MEVIDKDRPSQWNSILKKFRKPKIKTKKSKSESENFQFTEQEIVDEKDTNSFEETDTIVGKNTNYLEEQEIVDEKDTNSFEETDPIVEKNTNYLEEQDKKLEEFISTKESIEDKKLPPKIERYISIIKNLHQKEIGDFSRLESISHYLTDDQSLLYEDEVYLKDQFLEYKKATGINEEFEYEENLVPNKDPSEPQTILIDEAETEPTTNFKSLGVTIAKIIKDSTPHFTIGIYGEWGTGKTTLMKAIEKNLVTDGVSKTNQKILPIWFNAWQYDREENLATISLMKNVAYEMSGHSKFDPISKTILKGLTIVGKEITQNLIQEIIAKKEFENEDILEEKIGQINELYRESIYFDGLKNIKKQMEEIRKLHGKDCRVVVFIDDLDRCSPDKALEVLESIKLFLGMEGFIFVVGLSHKTVTELVTKAYAATGIRGEDYIKKIIQIPIKIPNWSQENIVDLIENKIKKNLHEKYTNFLSENSDMVAGVVDYNPRQLKRFINNVIIAFETFTSQKNSPQIKFNEIFLIKILKSEWPDFYTELVSNQDFLEIVKWILTRPKEFKKYFKYLNTFTEVDPIEKKQERFLMLNKLAERTEGRIDSRHCEILSDFDYETWIFFNHIKDVLFGIKDWNVINNIINVVEEFPYELPVGASQEKREPSK